MKCLQVAVTISAIWELVRYDLFMAIFGFKGIHEGMTHFAIAGPGRAAQRDVETHVCDAVARSMSVYGKRVRCLQRSVVTARMLRRRGVHAELVIGYRPVPFFSHAWVEVDGRVVNDSQRYKKLTTFERI